MHSFTRVALATSLLALLGCAPAPEVIDADPAFQPFDGFVLAPDDVWVVGASGGDPTFSGDESISHFDGEGWSAPVGRLGFRYQGVWASGSDDVWAVGSAVGVGFIERFDGAEWTIAWRSSEIGVDYGSLKDVWGSGPDDVWAVGTAGFAGTPGALVLHYDGEVWQPVPGPTEADDLIGVYVSPSGRRWVLDDLGRVFRSTDTGWQAVPSDLLGPPDHIGGEGEGALWLGGPGGVARFDGDGFVTVESSVRPAGYDAILLRSGQAVTLTLPDVVSYDCEPGFSPGSCEHTDGTRAELFVSDERGLLFATELAVPYDGEGVRPHIGSSLLLDPGPEADFAWVLGPRWWRVPL